MPSYIEIDQNVTFPSSSGAGKVILGVNANKEATITDNTGATTVIGSGGGGSVTPSAADFINVQSYNRWVYGTDAWSGGSKWDTIASEADQSDYLTFTFIGGTANGRPIQKDQTGQSITVDYTNLTYRDDGFGLFPVNYVDFINGIFQSQSLYTRLTGSTDNINYANDPLISGSIGFTGSYCVIDDFSFAFLEKGQIDGSNINIVLYSIKSIEGLNIADTLGAVSQNIYNSQPVYFYRVLLGNRFSAPYYPYYQIPAP
jgi:hypothetical protein